MRSLTLLFVIGLVLLMACKPEQAVPVLPTPVIPPLQVSLSADRMTGELSLSTTLRCKAMGSDGNYAYSWSGLSAGNCSGAECDVMIKTLGNHSVGCSVSSKNSTTSVSLVLQVTKRAKPIADVYVFGDSLSYGYGLVDPANESWPVLYSRSFNSAQLHNFAVTGADSRYLLDVELSRFRNGSYPVGDNLVFVWIGANDIQYLVAPQVFKQNYGQILDGLSNFTDVILMTIPDVSRLSVANDFQQGLDSFLLKSGLNIKVDVKTISQEVVTQYNDIIKAEGEARHLPVIDMFDFMSSVPDSILYSDRVHPNEEGHSLIAKRVSADVGSFYPDDELI
jgi:lysophospholipase L1-like esterase